MCDTLVALPGFTASGATVFGKNSDRERNEAQILELVPAARHRPGANLRATYIDLPQASRTHACLISRPYWMWGAEMGANAHGVVIGNEAVHSTVPAARRRALTGMDLVRLGLERSESASEAVEVIVALLERHGQGGDCGHLGRFYYHNSFLIADRREALVLETVGRWWVTERVAGAKAISNALGIGAGFHRLSAGLADHARTQGWAGPDGRFDVAARLIDEPRDKITFGRGRCARGERLLEGRRGALGASGMMAILRDHGSEAEGNPGWSPTQTVARTICMHAANGTRRSQTVGSLVSVLSKGRAVHWVTAGAAPCLSIFKPVLLEAGLPNQAPSPAGRYDPDSRWWRHERLHRGILRDFAALSSTLGPARDRLETSFIERLDSALARDRGPEALRDAQDACWREADAFEEVWLARLASSPIRQGAGDAYGRAWARLNQAAGFPRRDRSSTC